MGSNKTMIRFYLLLLILSALLSYIINLNEQFHFFSLNSPWISNAFCFSISSSIFAGVIVAMAAEIRQYWLHKRDARYALYTTAGELYALISIQRACIAYYITHNTDSIPNNIGDEHARQPIIARIEYLRSIDYSPFLSEDNISKALKLFSGQIYDIENTVRNLVELKIAYNRTAISFLENFRGQDAITSTSPFMLSALHEVYDGLNTSLAMLNEFCSLFEKINSKCFDWSRGKKVADDMGKKIEVNPYYRPNNNK